MTCSRIVCKIEGKLTRVQHSEFNSFLTLGNWEILSISLWYNLLNEKFQKETKQR